MTTKPVIGQIEQTVSTTAKIVSITMRGSEDGFTREFVLAVGGECLAGDFRMNDKGVERPLFPADFETLFGVSETDVLLGTSFEVRFDARKRGILRIAQPGTPVRFYGQKYLSGAKLKEDRLQFAQKLASESCRDAVDVINDARDTLGQMAEAVKLRCAQIHKADALVSDYDAPASNEEAVAGASQSSIVNGQSSISDDPEAIT